LQYLPRGFTTSSGSSKLCNEIILIDEKDRPSTLKLRYNKSSNRFCVSRGWRAFCCRNGYRTGCFLRIILVRKGKTPVLRIFPLERDEDNIGKFSTLLLLYVVSTAMLVRNGFYTRKTLKEG